MVSFAMEKYFSLRNIFCFSWFCLTEFISSNRVFLVVFRVFPRGSDDNLPAMQETQVLSLGQEDPLEEEMSTHSSLLA